MATQASDESELERLRAENKAYRAIVQEVVDTDDGMVIYRNCFLSDCHPKWNETAKRWIHYPECPVTKAQELIARSTAH